ncbi:MAG: response regulator [Gemmataceae bacterium]
MAAQPIEIMLIEDNSDDIDLTVRSLRDHGILNQIQILRDGEEAMAFFFDAPAAQDDLNDLRIVLLDLKLPKVYGLEVLERLKSDPRTKPIPVVMLTSSHEDQDIAKCYQLGANSYIVKPVDFAQFSEVVRELGKYWLVINKR